MGDIDTVYILSSDFVHLYVEETTMMLKNQHWTIFKKGWFNGNNHQSMMLGKSDKGSHEFEQLISSQGESDKGFSPFLTPSKTNWNHTVTFSYVFIHGSELSIHYVTFSCEINNHVKAVPSKGEHESAYT